MNVDTVRSMHHVQSTAPCTRRCSCSSAISLAFSSEEDGLSLTNEFNYSAEWIYRSNIDRLLIMDSGRVGDWKLSAIYRTRHEARRECYSTRIPAIGGPLSWNGSGGKKTGLTEKDIYRHLRRCERKQRDKVSESSAQTQLYCVANGRWFFIIEVEIARNCEMFPYYVHEIIQRRGNTKISRRVTKLSRLIHWEKNLVV